MFHLFRVFATVSLSPMLRRYNRLRLYRSYLVIIAVYPSNVFSSSSSFFFLFFPTIIEKTVMVWKVWNKKKIPMDSFDTSAY